MKKIAINGFGRIGRLAFRQLIERDDVTVVAVNDLTDNATLAHLLKYDTAHGRFNHDITSDDGAIYIDGNKVRSLSERDPSKLPWGDHDVDIVLECTGRFRKREEAALHLDAGAKNVLLSAPAKGGEVQTIVLGVNDESLDRSAKIYSNASCTTNCLAPVVKVIDQAYTIQSGFVTTIHAYTSSQNLQDAAHSDLRRARAAASNIIPTTTGAAKATELVYPAIKGKIHAMAYRVPTITGSLIELEVAVANAPSSADMINQIFKKAADGAMKGILGYTEDAIVSSDIIGDRHSSIFDSQLTQLNGDLIKVVSWYDNEGGYASRLVDLASKILEA